MGSYHHNLQVNLTDKLQTRRNQRRCSTNSPTSYLALYAQQLLFADIQPARSQGNYRWNISVNLVARIGDFLSVLNIEAVRDV
jgi:hypothetical protein